MEKLESYRPVWDRFAWNVTHLFSRKLNPYIIMGQGGLEPVERMAYQDFFHSLKNLFVEGARLYGIELRPSKWRKK